MAEATFISLYGKCGKIHIFKSTLRGLGYPKFVRFRLNPDGRILLEPHDRISLTSFRVPKHIDGIEGEQMEVSTTALIRAVFHEFKFDLSKSYRIEGKLYKEQRVAIFDISSANIIRESNRYTVPIIRDESSWKN